MKTKKLGAIGIAAAATMMVAAPAAMAGTLSHTYVTINGTVPDPLDHTDVRDIDVTGANDGSLNFVTDDSSTPMECADAEVHGIIKWGENVAVGPDEIGEITDLSFSNCFVFGPSGLPVIVEDNPGSWPIKVRSHPTNPGDPVDITIEGVSAYMHSTGATPWACELDATGDVEGTFYPGTTANGHDGRIVIDTPPAFPLTVDAFDGTGTKTPVMPGDNTCVLINDGEGVSMQGAFEIDVDPGQAVSGPISHG